MNEDWSTRGAPGVQRKKAISRVTDVSRLGRPDGHLYAPTLLSRLVFLSRTEVSPPLPPRPHCGLHVRPSDSGLQPVKEDHVRFTK